MNAARVVGSDVEDGSIENADASCEVQLAARRPARKGCAHSGDPTGKEPDMSKNVDTITEAVRDPKHPFRKIENQPKKAQRHRYERRKIKEYLHLADWLTEELV